MKPNNVLQTTVGYNALLNFLKDLLKEIKEDSRYEVNAYSAFLEKANQIDVTNLERYPFTSKTPVSYTHLDGV